jgi:hypothetical protein
MQKDKELELLTEEYLTKRMYAPRIDVSDALMLAIEKEFELHMKAGVNSKRILKAIEYAANSIESLKRKEDYETVEAPPEEGEEAIKGKWKPLPKIEPINVSLKDVGANNEE